LVPRFIVKKQIDNPTRSRGFSKNGIDCALDEPLNFTTNTKEDTKIKRFDLFKISAFFTFTKNDTLPCIFDYFQLAMKTLVLKLNIPRHSKVCLLANTLPFHKLSISPTCIMHCHKNKITVATYSFSCYCNLFFISNDLYVTI
jgi:hypothetical protein